jgi:alpha-beta hydrolase superfamily lysophospholipase
VAALGLLAGCLAAPPPPAPVPPARLWEPAGTVRAQLLALHGFGDHKGAFDGLGAFLAGHGIRTLAYDQRGFGEQPDRLFWSGPEALAADLVRAVERLRRERPGLPVLVLGESMGAAVALLALAGPGAPELDGVVLVAPAVWGGTTLAPLYRGLMHGLAAALPGLRLSGRGLPVRAAEDAGLLRALARDPLYIREPTAASVAGLIELMDRARAAGPALAAPTLVLVPGRDDIVPAAVQISFAATLGTPDCRLIRYPEARHLLLRDSGRERAWADLLAWLERREPPSGLAGPCRAPDPAG